MDTKIATETTSTNSYIFLNGKQLAEVLDVSAPSLSEAVKKGYNCAGYPVGDWAIETKSGGIKGYEVPEFLVNGEARKLEKRANPEELMPNEANIRPNKGKKSANQPNVIHNNYSLLPEGEDYVQMAGMVTLPAVIKKALEQDTPQSRVVITGGLTGMGAIIGHAITNSVGGAGVGALAGLGIAYLTYKYSKPVNNHNLKTNVLGTLYDQLKPSTSPFQNGQSGFIK